MERNVNNHIPYLMTFLQLQPLGKDVVLHSHHAAIVTWRLRFHSTRPRLDSLKDLKKLTLDLRCLLRRER